MGDVDGDKSPDRVTLRTDRERPKACRWVLVVETGVGSTMTAIVRPLGWPSAAHVPELRLLAEINGRAGLEVVVSLAPAPAGFRVGSLFTRLEDDLASMRLGGKDPASVPRLFPFYDEFTAGVDCARSPGVIVVTAGHFAPRGDDSLSRITRTFYESAGRVFRPKKRSSLVIDCCDGGAGRRWPETNDDPFRSCRGRTE